MFSSTFRRIGGKYAIGSCLFWVGFGALVFTIALVIRSYTPCPFWDEWVVVDAIGKGAGPSNFAWLWSQQNEHRIVIPRLLVWLDLFGFGGKNVSLFTEIIVVQLLHLAAISLVLERLTALPVFLKRTLQGLFAFCLFHPNQIENFTWAYQIGFVLPYALGTLALLVVAFVSRSRRPTPLIVIAAVISIVAAVNLAAGLLIAPVTCLIAYLKNIRRCWPPRLVRRRQNTTDFEWFLLGECTLTIATALLTATGRLQFGVGQAFASRYQTPAMIFWASLTSLVLIWIYESRPNRILIADSAVLVIMLWSVCTFQQAWIATVSRAESLRGACQRVMANPGDLRAASRLYENTSAVAGGRALLEKLWGRQEKFPHSEAAK